MAFINITGDSDGDLHTAALHNNKFGAMASLLNGNIDKDNLANPQNIYTMTFSGGPGTQLVTGPANDSESWVSIASLTSATADSNTHSTVNGDVQCLFPSWVKMINASTLVSCHLNYLATSAASATGPPAFVAYLQSSATLTGTYDTVHATSGTLNWNHASFLMRDDTFTINSAAIAANRYIRMVVVNPGANSFYPPKMTLTLTFKTYHVA